MINIGLSKSKRFLGLLFSSNKKYNKRMKTIILTVHFGGKYWRLGLSTDDSLKYFYHLETIKFILSKDLEINCNAACGTSKKKAFDFNNKYL
jgi:hypothetical protein